MASGHVLVSYCLTNAENQIAPKLGSLKQQSFILPYASTSQLESTDPGGAGLGSALLHAPLPTPTPRRASTYLGQVLTDMKAGFVFQFSILK